MHRKKGDDAGLRAGTFTLVVKDEVLNEQPVYLVKPNKKDHAAGLGGWYIAWQEASMNIAADRRLNLTDHRVLAVLNAKLDFENWIRISQSEIGEFLGVKQPNVSGSMRKLIELGIVVPGPSVKNVKTFRLNPAVSWKGTMQQAATERRKALRLVKGGKDDQAVVTVTTDPNQLPLF